MLASGRRAESTYGSGKLPQAVARKRNSISAAQLSANRVGLTQAKRRRGSKKCDDEVSASYTILFERCNVDALMDLASRRPAATYRPSGQGATLRRIIADLVGQFREDMLTTIFYEEGRMSRLGLDGRRYCGYKRESEIANFENLVSIGVSPGAVRTSLFRLPWPARLRPGRWWNTSRRP